MAQTDYVLLADALPAWAQGGAAMAIRLDAVGDPNPVPLTVAIVPGIIVGLRRQIVTATDGAVRARQPLLFSPWTPTLVRLARDYYRPLTGWNYDFPNPKTEDAASPQDVARIIERLREQVKILPMDIQIVGVQRRYLLYYSDGNARSQVRYLRLAPKPGRDSPFGDDWELRESYRNNTDYGTPLLYDGPAWTVRFTVDGVDPIPDCRVYVSDEGRFICSDWCQRTGYTTYGKGIDLQVQGYTLGSWIAGPVSQQGRIRLPSGSRITIMNQASKQRAQTIDAIDNQLAEVVPTVQAAWISGAETVAAVYNIIERHRLNGLALVDAPAHVREGAVIFSGRYSVWKGASVGTFVVNGTGRVLSCARHNVTIDAATMELDVEDVRNGPLGGQASGEQYKQHKFTIAHPIKLTDIKWHEVQSTPPVGEPLVFEAAPPPIGPAPQPAVESWEDIAPPQFHVELPLPEEPDEDPFIEPDDTPLGVVVLGKPSPVCWPCFVNYVLDPVTAMWSCPNGCGAAVLPFHYVKTQQCDNCGGYNHFLPSTHADVMAAAPCVWCNSFEKGHMFYGPAESQ